ncbi:MAG: hypothetical protein ACLRWM_07300 [Streptococcus sp.]
MKKEMQTFKNGQRTFDVYLKLENNDQDSNIVKFKNKMVENYQKTPNPLIVLIIINDTDTYVLLL